MTTLNENSILEYYDHLLNEMKIGDACATILTDEQFTEDEQQQVLGDILLPQLIVAFAEKYGSLRDDDGFDLQNFFEAFLTFEHIPADIGNAIALTINELSDEDNDEEDDDGVLPATPWNSLSNKERILKVKTFLKAIANSGEDHRDQKPFIRRGPGPDPYGNDFGKNVKVFDRKTNRYGATDNPTTERGTNSFLQHKPLPSLPIHESLLDVESASKVERYAAFMKNNKSFLNTMNCSESPAVALQEAGKLRDEHEKKFSNGDADYDPSDYLFGRATKGKGRIK